MSDRLLIPLGIPITFGFIGGVVVSVLQLGHGATIALGVACGALSLVSGAITAAGTDTTSAERKTGALLRSGLALGLFFFLFVATLSLLRDGDIVLAVILLALGGVYGVLLSRLRIFSRDQLRGQALGEFHRRRAGQH